jgi:hypothetical protein
VMPTPRRLDSLLLALIPPAVVLTSLPVMKNMFSSLDYFL